MDGATDVGNVENEVMLISTIYFNIYLNIYVMYMYM